MATFREMPYAAYNFLVGWSGLEEDSVLAGFQEVSGLDRGMEVLRYRAGNYRTLAPTLIPALAEPVVVRLSRGVIGDLGLHEWLSEAMAGGQEKRVVRIQLLSEDRGSVAMGWTLINALPVRIEGPRLVAGHSELAVDTLILEAEQLQVE